MSILVIIKMELRFLSFIIVLFKTFSLTEGVVWRRQPTQASGIQGQTVNITWTVELLVNKTWSFVQVYQRKFDDSEHEMIRFSKTTGKYVYSEYVSRHAELNLTASQNGSLLTSVFVIMNLNQSTDEHQYYLQINYTSISSNSSNLQLTVLVPIAINSPILSPVNVTVGKAAQLLCNATGNPTPSINWTRNGIIVGRGNPFTTPVVTFSDDKACYTCVAYNGVLDAKTANFCLDVQYNPKSTTLNNSKNNACLNDQVTLTCTTDANPPAYEYRFYLNDVHVHTSMSGTYQLNVPQAGNNTYKCEPVNTVGAGENATVTIATKAPPQINWSSPKKIAVEGNSVALMCNVSGSEPLNVTWSRVGGSSYPEGTSHTFSSIGRGDEATYQCTANNGNECPVATATSSITVIYKPESTNLTASKATALVNDRLNLTCNTHAKPDPKIYNFYQNNVLIQTQRTKTFSFLLSDNGIIVYKCQPENLAGNGFAAHVTVNVKVPAGIVSHSNTSVTSNENEQINLTCTVSGVPTPNVTWTRNGQLINNARGETYTFIGLESLSGSYACVVSNGFGEIQRKTFEVTIKGYCTDHKCMHGGICRSEGEGYKCYCTGGATGRYCETTDYSVVEGNKTLVAVLEAFLAVSIAVNIIFIAVIIWLCRKVSKGNSGKRSNNYKEKGQNNNISLEEISGAADNETTDMSQYQPTRMAGLAASNHVSPYARVPIIKPKPQQPQSDTQVTKDDETRDFPQDRRKGKRALLPPASNVGVLLNAKVPIIKPKPSQAQSDTQVTKDDETRDLPQDRRKGKRALLPPATNLGVLPNARVPIIKPKPIQAQSDIKITKDDETLDVPQGGATGRGGEPERTVGVVTPYARVTLKTKPFKQPPSVQQTDQMPLYENPHVNGLKVPDKKATPTPFRTFNPSADEYGSLSPSTRIPPKNKVAAPTGNPTRQEEYHASQYQPLNFQSKC